MGRAKPLPKPLEKDRGRPPWKSGRPRKEMMEMEYSGDYKNLPAGWTVLADVRTCGLTLGQALDLVESEQRRRPGFEVCMDGNLYAIVAKPRRARA